MKKILILLSMLFLSVSLYSQQKEKFYEAVFAKDINGSRQVVLSDKTRVDIVTDTFAIEVDFADKWAESVGQSLYYGYVLDKKPGVLLVVNGKEDNNFINRLMVIAMKKDITVWIMDYNTNKWKKVKQIYRYDY